jgi:hypothetical protein
MIGPQMWEATQHWNQSGKPARVFTEFMLGAQPLSQPLPSMLFYRSVGFADRPKQK